ncbi:integral membrane protein [Mycobacteroides abscessus subsp. abscessus]|uniref:DUF4395 domain-containing protein n=6 Tax=Mycobacteroides abscessus TaxID=36809 RepID=B1MI15_MYCA9|nr:DUF4395 domain-containing protein [Mycobacteroides abscessus]ETZ87853.1 hypothetical protein L829_1403 [Mycobacteroides abscessus MAB_030201_1075]ETZ94084.1 hypothetical protein L828_3491 [Mycobacteroides abscessus MAB_030201_1061]EUA45949.1 hypothetical protein I543_0821 [Mycobacteroides abscessus 21]EUA64566.1 hypothetical protein I542_4736 [Mycobacteroides abscessus 1948]AKP56960.1 hypothetical protein MAUC22_04175 [Mycobacteroides abscessus UC22]
MTTANTTPAISQVDVRGPRFSAWVTTTVLIITLAVSAVSPTAAAVILGLQAVVFAIGALLGPHRAPYGTIFRTLIQPRLSPVTEREPVPPLQFAQLLGFTFAAVGTVGFATGVTLLGVIATALALGAAFLNAAFGICLGCQIYPLITRLRRTQPSAQ